MFGTFNHHHHHHHNHKVNSPWLHSPLPSLRSLPSTKKYSKKYLALIHQGQHSAAEEATRSYFTHQPPMEPIKLVLVGDLPTQAYESHKMQQLVKNCKAINFYKDAVYGSHLSSTFRLCSKETIVTEKSLAPTSSAIYSLTDAIRYSHRESRKDKKDVRHLLHQLITNLPVSSTAAASDTSIISYNSPLQDLGLSQFGGVLPHSPGLASGLASAVTRSPSPHKRPSCCSVAVEARIVSSSEDKLTSLGTVEGEEWMGGVRALRDSHVRLVQRQLRHIERLNRALDRVTKNFSKNTNKHVHF